jgi:hypothetical protein
MNNSKAHVTNDEILYIKTIGSYSEHSSKMSKKELLTNYIKSLKLRFDWNNLDKDLIKNFAKSELKNAI